MGINVIINHTIGTINTWEPVVGIPQGVRAWSMQARGQNDFRYRYQNQTAYWTIKNGTVRSGSTPFPAGRLYVYCGASDVIEIECATAVRA